jgi:hypothetical protein
MLERLQWAGRGKRGFATPRHTIFVVFPSGGERLILIAHTVSLFRMRHIMDCFLRRGSYAALAVLSLCQSGGAATDAVTSNEDGHSGSIIARGDGGAVLFQ